MAQFWTDYSLKSGKPPCKWAAEAGSGDGKSIAGARTLLKMYTEADDEERGPGELPDHSNQEREKNNQPEKDVAN